MRLCSRTLMSLHNAGESAIVTLTRNFFFIFSLRFTLFLILHNFLLCLRIEIPLLIGDLFGTALSEVCSVDGLGIVVRYVGSLTSLGDRVIHLVDEMNEFSAFVVSDVDVLSDHYNLGFQRYI